MRADKSSHTFGRLTYVPYNVTRASDVCVDSGTAHGKLPVGRTSSRSGDAGADDTTEQDKRECGLVMGVLPAICCMQSCCDGYAGRVSDLIVDIWRRAANEDQVVRDHEENDDHYLHV